MVCYLRAIVVANICTLSTQFLPSMTLCECGYIHDLKGRVLNEPILKLGRQILGDKSSDSLISFSEMPALHMDPIPQVLPGKVHSW